MFDWDKLWELTVAQPAAEPAAEPAAGSRGCRASKLETVVMEQLPRAHHTRLTA